MDLNMIYTASPDYSVIKSVADGVTLDGLDNLDVKTSFTKIPSSVFMDKSKSKEDKSVLNSDVSVTLQPVMNKKDDLSYYLKSEASVSTEDKSCSGYSGLGMKYLGENGSAEAFLAAKNTETSYGDFFELKYTTNKILDTNCSLEARGRVFTNWNKDGGKPVYSSNFRGTIGWSDKYDDWGFYARTGVSANISMHGKGVQTVSPMGLIGISYDFTPETSGYMELEASKPYDCKEKQWSERVTSSINIGCKTNF